MEKKSEEPFISFLKDNLKTPNTYRNLLPNNNAINDNFNESIEEELVKKIGKMETILNYYEAKLNNEFNERKLLERKYEEKIEILTKDINNIKYNFDYFSKLFTDKFTKIKTNILENIENKNNSINKIIFESAKRINTLEDIILFSNINNNINDNIVTSKSANNSIFFSTERDSSFMKHNYTFLYNGKFEILSKKINQLESIVCNKGNYPEREEEISRGISKINHIEKKFEIFLENYDKDMNIINKNSNQYKNNIEYLNTYYEVLNEKFNNLYKNFNDTHTNINKFNYQTTILLNETQKKIDEYNKFFNNTKKELNKLENDLSNEYSLLKEVINEKIDDFDKNIKEFKSQINIENNEFKNNIEDKQEKFINYIQIENNSCLHDVKKVENNIEKQFNIVKKENNELNKNLNEIKNAFFHNLNEIEQYFNNKYQSLSKAINLKDI